MNKNLLYSTGNSTQYSVMTYVEKKLKNSGYMYIYGLPRWFSGQRICLQCRSHKSRKLDPWVRKIPLRRIWQPTSVFLPGKSHGQRNLAGFSPWSHRIGRDSLIGNTHTNLVFVSI